MRCKQVGRTLRFDNPEDVQLVLTLIQRAEEYRDAFWSEGKSAVEWISDISAAEYGLKKVARVDFYTPPETEDE